MQSQGLGRGIKFPISLSFPEAVSKAAPVSVLCQSKSGAQVTSRASEEKPRSGWLPQEGPVGSCGGAAGQSSLSTQGAAALLCPRSSAQRSARNEVAQNNRAYWERSTVTYGESGGPQLPPHGEALQGRKGEGVQLGR